MKASSTADEVVIVESWYGKGVIGEVLVWGRSDWSLGRALLRLHEGNHSGNLKIRFLNP